MTTTPKTQRDLFESAVIERMKESGFLEVEIRVECLARCDDGYQDEVINAGWHYWNAALEVLRLRTALSETETDARSPFTIVAEWHDKQARRFKEMSQDDRSGELGKAKAAAAAKHHAGSAAAMRLQAINERQRALQSEDN